MDDRSIINFFAGLTLTEYDRLIVLFETQSYALSPGLRHKLLTILYKLRNAKNAAAKARGAAEAETASHAGGDAGTRP